MKKIILLSVVLLILSGCGSTNEKVTICTPNTLGVYLESSKTIISVGDEVTKLTTISVLETESPEQAEATLKLMEKVATELSENVGITSSVAIADQQNVAVMLEINYKEAIESSKEALIEAGYLVEGEESVSLEKLVSEIEADDNNCLSME